MVPYIVRRTLLSVFTLFTISYLSFVIIELPEGDFVDFYARFVEQTTGRSVSFDEMEDMRESFGLNRPQIVQYWDWVSGVVTGDFGYAYLFGDLRTPIRNAYCRTTADHDIPHGLYHSFYLCAFDTRLGSTRRSGSTLSVTTRSLSWVSRALLCPISCSASC